MATYPIKMLKDKDGTLFIPLTNSDSVQTSTGDTLENLISSKVDKETGKGLSTNDYTTTEKNKLAGIAANAEVNQNAFSNVKVGSSTIAADSKTDTLELVAGSNITLTPDTTNDKVTIAASQPTVNDGTLTMQVKGSTVQTFSANQSSNVTANITSIPSDIVVPAVTKTYTDIIGNSSDNTYAQNAFFYGSVRPTSFTSGWSCTYRVHVWIPNNTNYDVVSEVHLFGDQGSVNAYAIFNHFYSTSYRPAYYHTVARLKQAGYTAGYGHALAINLADSTNRADTSLKRSFTVEVLEQNNCIMTLNDTAVKWASWTGTGSTNYADPGNYNLSSNGMQETGDSDTTYQLRSYYARFLVGTNTLYGYSLCTMTDTGTLQGFVLSKTTNTGKSKNPATFRIGAPIYYYGSNTDKAANSYPGDNTLIMQTSTVDLRYSTNCASTLTANKAVYLVGVPNGSTYTLADTWWTQTLPTTDDGKIYIYLGVAYSTYQIAWEAEHPVYWYKNGALQLYNATATTAIGDKNGNDITTTYYLASNPNGYTSNTGTITKVQANGTDVASSGTANIPAASTGAYGVTKLSDATNSTSTALAATANAVKKAYDLAASKTSNTGTVTSVGLTAGSGISISGSPVTSSGSITVGHSNSITAQTTSGLYPIKIDAQGHITQYGTAYEIATEQEILDMLEDMGINVYTVVPNNPTDYIYTAQEAE